MKIFFGVAIRQRTESSALCVVEYDAHREGGRLARHFRVGRHDHLVTALSLAVQYSPERWELH